MKNRQLTARFWILFSIATFAILAAAAILWSRQHPFGVHWDEAQYLNESAVDTQRLRAGALVKLVGRILLKSWGRPPAYRILAAPFLGLFGFHTAVARLVTLACFGLSAWFISKATARIANPSAGAFAALLFLLSPQAFGASIWYSTEGPLYLATSAMLYYVFEIWSEDAELRRNWIGLGVAVGLGLLSKTTFVLIALPVVALAFVVGFRRTEQKQTLRPLLKAAGVTLILAAPWWAVNLKSSIGYAGYARGFVRDSLGSPSLAIWMDWFHSVLISLLGYGISIIIAIVLLGLVVQLIRKQVNFSLREKMALGTCACAGVPVVIAQLSGTNHLLRHISPAVIPLAIAVALIANSIGLVQSKVGIAVCSVLLCAQLIMILYPEFKPNRTDIDSGMVNGSLPWRILAQFDQWNWQPVKAVGDSCGVKEPSIAYLGDGRALNEAQIQFPWALQGIHADAQLLWRYEDGSLDWAKVIDQAERSDLVVTAPGYVGDVMDKEDRDNQYNSEFRDRLSRDPHFQEPIHVQMGRFESVDVTVFANRNLHCSAPGQDHASR